MSFVHLHFYGRTTSPWHVGKTRYGDYLYTRDDLLWGRGIRGPVLRQLWRVYCPKSEGREKVAFVPEKDCSLCKMAGDCPFWNLRGTADEGEFKDKPRLIIGNLHFVGDVKRGRVALATVDDQFLSVVPGRAPVFVEYLCEGVEFEFEVIFMGAGVRFVDEFVSAVKVSLSFHGWGGFCNEGFGRGVISNVKRHSFDEFEKMYVKPVVDRLVGCESCCFRIEPLLMLDRDGGGFYRSVFEDGFREKFCNCVNERFWQFYGRHVHVQRFVAGFGGRARSVRIYGWSRRFGSRKEFVGVGNELCLRFSGVLGGDGVRALALMKYGVGRFKNQGFGCLMLK